MMKNMLLCGIVSSILLLGGCSTSPQKPGVPSPRADAGSSVVVSDTTESPKQELPEIDRSLPSQANMYYVKLDDGGRAGEMIGCNDSLIAVPTVLDSMFTSREEVLTYVYKLQVGAKAKPDNLATTLTPDLKVTDLSVNKGKAAISFSGTVLLGGACDIPRAKEQLTAVALQFPQITEVDIEINGTPIDEYFSSQ